MQAAETVTEIETATPLELTLDHAEHLERAEPEADVPNLIAPIPMECDAPFLTVIGDLPRELNGTLYRNGPNPLFPTPDAHWFLGDGMLHAFTLDNGRARYRNRWVRTAGWQAQQAAGHALGDGFGRPAPSNGENDGAEPVADEGVANTHIVWHGGRLLALEEAHLPFEVEPGTLARRGPVDFGGAESLAIAGPFTAHPKIDPATGEMLFFGYGASGPLSKGMTDGSIDASGRVTRFEHFEAPYASMAHDFAVTSGHLLFPVLPLTASMARAERGMPPFAWEPEMGARVGVMPRGGSAADLRWFEGDACFVFHVMNAWEECDARGGICILADVMRFDEPPLFPWPDGRPTDPERSRARLWRWTFDLASSSNRFTQQPLADLVGEFPRIDDRRAGLANRHGWYACERADDTTRGYDALAHVDHRTGAHAVYQLPLGDKFSEPVFVPRSPEAAEGDGWLLVVVFRAAENRSDLAVLEATDIARGPVALVQLGHRVPAGFHGNWVGAQSGG